MTMVLLVVVMVRVGLTSVVGVVTENVVLCC